MIARDETRDTGGCDGDAVLSSVLISLGTPMITRKSYAKLGGVSM